MSEGGREYVECEGGPGVGARVRRRGLICSITHEQLDNAHKYTDMHVRALEQTHIVHTRVLYSHSQGVQYHSWLVQTCVHVQVHTCACSECMHVRVDE